jgi:hypothetical protein
MATNDRFFHAKQEWERLALLQLYRDYEHALRLHKVTLVAAAIELFDSETLWGQWDPATRTIRLARRLLKSYNWFQVNGILLHEMAHQYVDECHPGGREDGKNHGEVFRAACAKLGVPAEFTKASADLQSHNLDWREQKRDEASEKMLEKVQKLLALAESSNENEALLAMNRVRELYAKHNLERLQNQRDDDIIHIVVTSGLKRIESYEQQIVGILVGHFFVQVISGALYDAPSGEYHRSFEIIGRRENAVMAEYVFHFLKSQTQFLVVAAEKARGRKFTHLERKSYRLGILRGFAAKLQAAEAAPARASAGKSSGEGFGERASSSSTGMASGAAGRGASSPASADVFAAARADGEVNLLAKAIVAFKKDTSLDAYLARVYPRLRKGNGSSLTIDPGAYSAGHSVGGAISLHRPITSNDGNRGKLLGR